MASIARTATVTLDPKENYLMMRAMRKNMTITAAAVKKIWRSRCVGRGMEPGHRDSGGRQAGPNTDQDVPRLVVAHDPPILEDMPVTLGFTIR